MKSMFRRFSLLLIVCFFSSSTLLAQCGVERWSVKTGTDPDAGLVNLNSSTSTTVANMRPLPRPIRSLRTIA